MDLIALGWVEVEPTEVTDDCIEWPASVPGCITQGTLDQTRNRYVVKCRAEEENFTFERQGKGFRIVALTNDWGSPRGPRVLDTEFPPPGLPDASRGCNITQLHGRNA
jgi:hypothetical protein